MTPKEIEDSFAGGDFHKILEFARTNPNLEIKHEALELANRLSMLEASFKGGFIPYPEYSNILALIRKSVLAFMQKLTESESQSFIMSNDLLTLTKENGIYELIWYSMYSYDDYIISLSSVLGNINGTSFEENSIKVLVDNINLEPEEVFKLLDYKLAEKIKKVFSLSGIKKNCVIFTVFEKKNPYVEAILNQVYQSLNEVSDNGKLKTAIFLDKDLAKLKLIKYEG